MADSQERIKRASFNVTAAWEGGRGYANYQTYDSGIISYGRFQFTLRAGSLSRVVQNYLAASTTDTASQLHGYQDRIKAGDPTLREDEMLKNLLVRAAEEPTMQDAQDKVVEASYWAPSQDSANSRGIVSPLGQALLFDMAIQHGPAHKLTQEAEKQLGVPAKSKLGDNGLTEEQLITRTAQVRRDYLYDFAARNNLGGVKKRADFWVELVGKGDWQLQGDGDGNVFVYGKPVQVRTPVGARTGAPTAPSAGSAPAAAPSGEAQPGQPVKGTYTTRDTLSVRKTPSASGEKLGRVRKGKVLQALRQYMPSASEEWILTEVGWIARRHPDYPGEVFGDLAVS